MDVEDLREQALGAGTRASAAAARNRALEGAARGAARRNGRTQVESKPFPTAAVLGGLALSLFMAALDATIVSTAMPKRLRMYKRNFVFIVLLSFHSRIGRPLAARTDRNVAVAKSTYMN